MHVRVGTWRPVVNLFPLAVAGALISRDVSSRVVTVVPGSSSYGTAPRFVWLFLVCEIISTDI